MNIFLTHYNNSQELIGRAYIEHLFFYFINDIRNVFKKQNKNSTSILIDTQKRIQVLNFTSIHLQFIYFT